MILSTYISNPNKSEYIVINVCMWYLYHHPYLQIMYPKNKIQEKIAIISNTDLTDLVTAHGERFRDEAPTTAAQAAEIILNAVQHDRWRVLVGDDAVTIDELVREDPESAYKPEFRQRIIDRGHLNFLGRR